MKRDLCNTIWFHSGFQADTSATGKDVFSFFEAVADAILQDGFVAIRAPENEHDFQRPATSSDWADFSASWGSLVRDEFMGDGGRYRQRRFASFNSKHDQALRLNAHRPHYQDLNFNNLNGGIERWFAAIEARVIENPIVLAILNVVQKTFDLCDPSATAWDIEVHQFRIIAEDDQSGRPTPEGPHRDGVDYVFMMLVDRQNVEGGVTRLTTDDGRPLAEVELTEPGDAVLLDDARNRHSVSKIALLNQHDLGCRDMLVPTFKRQ
jgi:hypothetical protein